MVATVSPLIGDAFSGQMIFFGFCDRVELSRDVGL